MTPLAPQERNLSRWVASLEVVTKWWWVEGSETVIVCFLENVVYGIAGIGPEWI